MAAKTSESSAYRLQLEEVPTYHPTMEQFANPMTYIASIREEAEHFGLARIVPPEGWKPPWLIDGKKFTFATRVQVQNNGSHRPSSWQPGRKSSATPPALRGEQVVVMAGSTAHCVHTEKRGVCGFYSCGGSAGRLGGDVDVLLCRAGVKAVGGRPTEPLTAHFVSNRRPWHLTGGSAGQKRVGFRLLGSHSSCLG
jgi:hypothetical protein